MESFPGLKEVKYNLTAKSAWVQLTSLENSELYDLESSKLEIRANTN